MEEYIIVNNKLLHKMSEHEHFNTCLHFPCAMNSFIVENLELQESERYSVFPIIAEIFNRNHDADGIFNREF